MGTLPEGIKRSFNAAKEVAGKFPCPARERSWISALPWLYSIEIRANTRPYEHDTELPGAIESASIIANDMTTPVAPHIAGDALTDDLGTDEYDLVLINNLVHHFTADQNRMLALKVARALKPGGLFAIGDMIRAATPGEGGVIASTFGLYLSLTSASENWSSTEIESWQRAAGLTPEKPLAAMSIPGWKMLVARKAIDALS